MALSASLSTSALELDNPVAELELGEFDARLSTEIDDEATTSEAVVLELSDLDVGAGDVI